MPLLIAACFGVVFVVVDGGVCGVGAGAVVDVADFGAGAGVDGVVANGTVLVEFVALVVLVVVLTVLVLVVLVVLVMIAIICCFVVVVVVVAVTAMAVVDGGVNACDLDAVQQCVPAPAGRPPPTPA